MILFNEKPETDAPGDNPFTDHADNYDGDTVQQLSSMTSDELLEHERYWKWEGDEHQQPYSRWWCSKARSRATAVLHRRAFGHDKG